MSYRTNTYHGDSANRARTPTRAARGAVSLCLSVICMMSALVGRSASAQSDDWTVMILLPGTYADTEERLTWTGSSARVNVVVLHDDSSGLRAYKMLPDPDTTHPAGDCCSAGQGCCQSQDIPLSDIGLSAGQSMAMPSVLQSFFAYVVSKFPAQHYAVSMRGTPDLPSTFALPDRITELVGLIGHKLELLNLGFCLGGPVDEVYGYREVVDYFVGSQNFTNPPVAMRWRPHLWIRDLIKTPTMPTSELAEAITVAFADTSDYCVSAGHYCSNTNPPNDTVTRNEPWAISAYDLSKVSGIAVAVRELVCALSDNFSANSTAFEAAKQSALFYEHEQTLDLRYFAARIRDLSSSSAVKTAADGVIAAIEQAIIAHVYQQAPYATGRQGWFDNGPNASGASTTLESSYKPAGGRYIYDSMWRSLLRISQGLAKPTVGSLSIQPTPLKLVVGQSGQVEARGVSQTYGPMCKVAVTWDTASLAGVGALTTTGNPATIQASTVGTGTLKATFNNMSATVSVEVTAAPNPNDPAIALEPPALSFGEVEVGTTSALTTTIRNAGKGTLSVTGISPCSGTPSRFTWTPAVPIQVAGGAGVVLRVTYAPTSATTDSGCLTLASNDPTNPNTTLTITASGTNEPATTLDVDIDALVVPGNVDPATTRSITPKLQVRNRSSVGGSASATVTAKMLNAEVYRQTTTVTTTPGESKEATLAPYALSSSSQGSILWTATLADQNADADEVSATTVLGAASPSKSPVTSSGCNGAGGSVGLLGIALGLLAAGSGLRRKARKA
jgi:hypothetical protein